MSERDMLIPIKNIKIPSSSELSDTALIIYSAIDLLKSSKKLIIGINPSFNKIIKSEVKLVIISSGINPTNIIEHILIVCCKNKIPVIFTNINASDMGKIFSLDNVAVISLTIDVDEEVLNKLLHLSVILNEQDYMY